MNNWNPAPQGGPVMQYQPPTKKRVPAWVHVICYIAVAVLSLGIGVGLGATDNTATETVENSTPTTETPTTTTNTPRPKVVAESPPAKPKSKFLAEFSDGTYEVGTDIKPGKYKTTESDNALCYWARLKSLDDEMNMYANHFGAAKTLTVVIKKGDAGFKTSSCGTWKLVK